MTGGTGDKDEQHDGLIFPICMTMGQGGKIICTDLHHGMEGKQAWIVHRFRGKGKARKGGSGRASQDWLIRLKLLTAQEHMPLAK